jgi:hypothetical protein
MADDSTFPFGFTPLGLYLKHPLLEAEECGHPIVGKSLDARGRSRRGDADGLNVEDMDRVTLTRTCRESVARLIVSLSHVGQSSGWIRRFFSMKTAW